MLRWAIAFILLATAHADAKPAAPCKGCTLDVPESKDPIALVVVLHGDREHAPAAAARWRAAAKRAGFALLSLECPKDKGCKDSYWQWDGDPSWVQDQVDAVEKQVAIDPHRRFLIGWSGGASYIGAHAKSFEPKFAAVVFHGGGMTGASADCPERLPAYFLIGDRNPLHQLAKDLHGYFDGCKQDVTWDVVRGADHAKEAAALTAKKADEILGWLDQHHS